MKHEVLEAKSVTYYSDYDEAAFFEWLDKIKCVEKYEGYLTTLKIYVDHAKIDQYTLRELLSLFQRYGVDMKQLKAFDDEQFADWFRDPSNYWFEAIFGS